MLNCSSKVSYWLKTVTKCQQGNYRGRQTHARHPQHPPVSNVPWAGTVCAVWDKQLLSVCTDKSAIVFPCVWLAKQSLGFNATCFPNHSLIPWKEATLCLEQQQEKRRRDAAQAVEQQLGSSSILEVLRAESWDSHGLVKPTASEELSKASTEMSIATKPSNTKCFSSSVECKSSSKWQLFAVLASNSTSFLQTLGITFSRFQAFCRSVFQMTALLLESLDYLGVTCTSLCQLEHGWDPSCSVRH